MVTNMNNLLKNKKAQRSIFWEALILSIFIFASGIFLGYLLEKNRTNDIITLYQQSELDLLDMKVQDNILSTIDLRCSKFFNETISFADRVYEEAKLLEKYEGANEITEGIEIQHKKYDLLRTILWTDTIRLKERCVTNFSTVVYFYEYNSQDQDLRAEQSVFAKKLEEIKQEQGDKLILIPIAGNLDVNSIEYLKFSYNITRLPSVLIDEETKIESIEELSSINSYFS